MGDKGEMSLLGVDDSVDLAEAMGALLRSKGYEVRTATDGAAAVALVAAAPPPCVIVDVRMPGMPGTDGYEFARRLRAQYRDHIVLVAMCGRESNEPDLLATSSIVDHYLPKPLDFLELKRFCLDGPGARQNEPVTSNYYS